MAEVLLGNASGAFDWNKESETVFHVSAAGTTPPVEYVLNFLENARLITRAPAGSSLTKSWKSGWGDEPEIDVPGKPFPIREPSGADKLPVVMRDENSGAEIVIDYWGDSTRRNNVKFWAGAGGYYGVAILRDILSCARGRMLQHISDPFSLSGVQTNSFRFDWRRDYIAVQDGFSTNKHKNIKMIGFPLVELFAAIGMTNARPKGFSKLKYRYGVLGCADNSLLDPLFHRFALGAGSTPIPGHPFRRFVMNLGWPGKEGQARCITQVFEE